jgi:hypothetical protein
MLQYTPPSTTIKNIKIFFCKRNHQNERKDKTTDWEKVCAEEII